MKTSGKFFPLFLSGDVRLWRALDPLPRCRKGLFCPLFEREVNGIKAPFCRIAPNCESWVSMLPTPPFCFRTVAWAVSHQSRHSPPALSQLPKYKIGPPLSELSRVSKFCLRDCWSDRSTLRPSVRWWQTGSGAYRSGLLVEVGPWVVDKGGGEKYFCSFVSSSSQQRTKPGRRIPRCLFVRRALPLPTYRLLHTTLKRS